MDSLSDTQLVLAAAASFAGIYGLLSFVLPHSQIPLLLAVFVGSNMISRTSVFQRAIRLAVEHLQRRRVALFSGGDRNAPEEHRRFEALAGTAKIELLSAIKSLDAYLKHCKNYNARRRKLFKLLSWRQQKLCEEAGYLQKLKQIDLHIDKNQRVLHDIIYSAKQEYGLIYRDFGLLDGEKNLPNTSSTNYRVIEALTHFVRDWTSDGAEECGPLLKFVKEQLLKVIPENEAADTCIVVPGSGLGRVAHEIATYRDYGAVYAVEFSGLMHACNKFVYQQKKDHTVKTWDLVTSKCVDTRSTGFSLLSIAQLPQVNLLATGSSARHINLHDPRALSGATELQTTKLLGHTYFVVSLAVCPNNPQMFASGSHDGTVRVWDVRSDQPLYTIKRESGAPQGQNKVFGVAWDKDIGIVSGGEDKKLQINKGNNIA